MRRIVLVLVFLIAVAAGSYQIFLKPDPIVLPPVQSLTASEADLQALYGFDRGPYAVQAIDVIELPREGAPLDVSVFYPDADGQFPLILFSHGNFSSRDQYNSLIHHWVSHGYTVIAPDHLDSGGTAAGIWAMTRHGKDGVLIQRPEDLTFILDEIEQFQMLAPEFFGRVDQANIAAAGHSFGAFSAQMLGGSTAVHPKSGAVIAHDDARIKAIVAISPPGPMFDMITETSWHGLRLPQIVTTGTWDVEARFWPEWQLHAMSYWNAPMGENYLLVTEGADHYFGNLICRLDRGADSQHDALNMALSTTTAFLDAYVKGETEAYEYLNGMKMTDVTDGFSKLSRR